MAGRAWSWQSATACNAESAEQHGEAVLPPCCRPNQPPAWPAALSFAAQALPGVSGGDTLNFTFTATLAGAGSTKASLQLTALSSALEAAIDGPRGDVLVRALTVFTAGCRHSWQHASMSCFTAPTMPCTLALRACWLLWGSSSGTIQPLLLSWGSP